METSYFIEKACEMDRKALQYSKEALANIEKGHSTHMKTKGAHNAA